MKKLSRFRSRTGFDRNHLISCLVLFVGIFVGIVACGKVSQESPDAASGEEETTLTHNASDQANHQESDFSDTDSIHPSTQKFGVKLYAMNCGKIEISDLDAFSTMGDYAGQSATYTSTCYLIDHPSGKLLWDTGLPAALAGEAPLVNGIFTLSLEKTLTQHLQSIQLQADDINYIAISHSHFDHIGQAGDFSNAIWLANSTEIEHMVDRASKPDAADADALNVLLNMQQLNTGVEEDVFGDGSVIIFQTPGHTPGHTSLQVMLDEAGPVLLTGDLYHRRESRTKQRVPRFNTDEEETRASMATFEARAAKLGAMVVIQHDVESVSQLPVFPTSIQ